MKNIIWDTNFNGKMACNRFLHIDLAPETMPTIAQMKKTVVTIKAADNSHPSIQTRITNIIPFRIAELSNIHTWPSHGMDTSEYMHWQHQKKTINRDTMVAVYYYQKIQ